MNVAVVQVLMLLSLFSGLFAIEKAAEPKKDAQSSATQSTLQATGADTAKAQAVQAKKDASAKPVNPTLQPTAVEKSEIIAAKNALKPQPYDDFRVIPGDMKCVDIAIGGSNPIIVGCKQDKLYKLKSDYDSWDEITPTASEIEAVLGSKEDIAFVQIAVSADGALWALDNKGRPWQRTTVWRCASKKTFKSIAVGNCNEVVALTDHHTIERKKDPMNAKVEYLDAWQELRDQAESVTVTGDGLIYKTDTDQSLYLFDRYKKAWIYVAKTAAIGMGGAAKVYGKDMFNVVFLDHQKRGWHLIPGRFGSSALDWEPVDGKKNFQQLVIGIDGTMLGIDTNGQLLLKRLNEDGVVRLLDGRGDQIHANQMLRLSAGKNLGEVRLWTHAASAYDPNGNALPPNDYFETLIGGDQSDPRQDVGSFYSFLLGDQDATDVLSYGDTIEICPLVALPGNPMKSGLLSKDRRWFCIKNHFSAGQQFGDVPISLLSNPAIAAKKHLFKIVSPYGLQGNVRSSETIELQSLSPDTNGKKIWTIPWSRWDRSFSSLMITLGDDADGMNDFYGSRDAGGYQHFLMHPLAVVKDLPETQAVTWRSSSGRNVALTARDIFARLAGIFWKDDKQAPQPPKAPLVATTSDCGIGVIDELENATAFPMQTSIGTINSLQSKAGIEVDLANVFTLKGFAKDAGINNFSTGNIITVGPLWSNGFVWTDQPLEELGKGMISFMARAGDEGNIQIILGRELTTKCDLRIIIGGWDNSKSAIVYDGKIIAETTKEENPLAAAVAKRFVSYWVSINKGFILVGGDMPGSNIFLSCCIADLPDARYIGFSTHGGAVDFSEVSVSRPLNCFASDTKYNAKPQVFALLPDAKTVAYPLQLRSQNEGAIEFSLKEKSKTIIRFSTPTGEQYSVVFGDNDGCEIQIQRNGVVVLKHYTEVLKIDRKKDLAAWISLSGGVIVVGLGSMGENPFLVWQDLDILSGINRVSFNCYGSRQEVTVNAFTPPVEIAFERSTSLYQNSPQLIQATAALIILRPYHYDLIQDGQWVSLKDMLSGLNFHVIKTPEQGRRYQIFAHVAEDGMPRLLVSGSTEAPAKLGLRLGAATMNTAATAINMAAMSVQQSAMAEGEVASQDPELVSGLVLLGINATLAAAAAALSAVAAQVKAGGARMLMHERMDYRSDKSFVFHEGVKRDAGTKQSVPPEAARNAVAVQDLLSKIRGLNLALEPQYTQALALLQEMLRRITHPYVIEKPGMSQEIRNYINGIIANSKHFPVQAKDTLAMLAKAQDNLFLIGMSDIADVDERKAIFAAMTDVSAQVFMQKKLGVIQLPALKGEYLFIPQMLDENGNGIITFEVAGSGDLVVSLCQQPLSSRDGTNHVYEIGIGTWNNTLYEIRTKSLGRPSAVSHKAKMGPIFINQRKYQAYWIKKNGATISFGSGKDIDKNVILSWTDPFPWDGISRIGFATWEQPLAIRKLVVRGLDGKTSKVVTPVPLSNTSDDSGDANPVSPGAKSSLRSSKPESAKPEEKVKIVHTKRRTRR